MLALIKGVRNNKHKKAYGAPRMKEELIDKYGVKVSLRRITRLMRDNSLEVKGIKKFVAQKKSKLSDRAKKYSR